MAKIKTNIPQLDTLLGGGLEEGSLNCIWVQPGLDGTPFAYQIAFNAGKTNKVFYVANTKAPEIVKEEMISLGFEAGKINFIDAYSALVGAKTGASLLIANPKDPEEILNDVNTIVKKIKNHLIVLDSYSNLIDLAELKKADFIRKLKELKATAVCLFTEWSYPSELVKELREVFDTIIEVKAVEQKLFSREFFGVSKLGKEKAPQQAIPYKVIRPGGIKIYIPKILVTGPFGAGKTSFIHTASERAVSVDRLGTTIALDHGHVKYKDFAVDLFGTPGQQRFDPILKLLGGEALGVVVVISAIDPQGFPRAIEMMQKAKVYGLPVVFVANKSNLKGALSVAQIKTRMNLKEEIIVPVTAKDLTKVQPGLPCLLKQEDVENVLEALFGTVLEGNNSSGNKK